MNTYYRLAADLVLYLHIAFVVVVIAGLVLILIGGFVNWAWVRNGWFRLAHLGAIGIVVLQSWLGMICPLTTLEMWLRERAGDAVYPGAFVAHWVQRILYYDLPAWVFALGYTAFAVLVVASWYWVRPGPIKTNKGA